MSHDSSHPSADNPPWYRQFWVWFIIVLPATAVIGGISTVVIAVKNADDVVADDWYKQGRGINRSMAEEQLAERLGLSVALRAVGAETEASMTASQPLPWPETLEIALQHPTIAERDTALTFTHVDAGTYRSSSSLPAGRWQATVKPDSGNWRIQQAVSIAENGHAEIRSLP